MRISEELRGRTRRYAGEMIRLYVGLPRDRREVEVVVVGQRKTESGKLKFG